MFRCRPGGRHRSARYSLAALVLSMVLLPALASALPDDREQPIHIAADKAVRDEKQGFTVYSGDVQMNQGSMHIQADKITIYHAEEEADKIVAEGRPAKMRQRPDLEKGPVHARARTIEYYQSEQIVHLQTDARIEQDGATVAGDSIDYFITQQLVKADSDQARAGNRVQVVIPPAAQQSLGLAPGGEPAAAEQATAPDKAEQAAAAAAEPAPDPQEPATAAPDTAALPAQPTTAAPDANQPEDAPETEENASVAADSQ